MVVEIGNHRLEDEEDVIEASSQDIKVTWLSAVNETPRGLSKCFQSWPSKPYLAKKSPSGENN